MTTSPAAKTTPSQVVLPATAFPFLPGESPASVSIGNTSTGRLVRGRRLAESEALAILPNQRARGYRHGTDELVAMLEHAAASLHQATGTKLWVGHLSRPEGGDIPYSVSHNAGRDADIAFCYRDARGKPVDPDWLIPVVPNGRSLRRGVHLDVARTWRVVKALITYPGAEVQYLFVSRSIEGHLLQHAKAIGEAKAVRKRAEALLQQPGGRAARHHDHLHLRIYCSRDDLVAGCENAGRFHPWTKRYTADRAGFTEQLVELTTHREAEVRRRATLRLGLVGAVDAADAVVKRLGDKTPSVQLAGLTALAALDTRRRAAEGFLEGLHAPRQRDAAEALAADVSGGPLLAHLIRHADDEVLGDIIDLTGKTRHLVAVPALVTHLAHDDVAIRTQAARTLGRLTAHRFARHYRDPPGDTLELKRQKWRSAWSAAKAWPRRAWLRDGFIRGGYEVGKLEPADAWVLVRALGDRDHLAYNADELLAELFDHRAPEGSFAERCTHWRTWLTERRKAYELEAAPQDLCRPRRRR